MGGEKFALKALAAEGIPQAVEKAERYRLLNDPEQAESICRDILAVDPDHQATLRMMVLTLADQFRTPDGRGNVREARELVLRLSDEYSRAYFTGIVLERDARAYLERGGVRSTAYDGFRAAMEWYEKAEAHRPAGNFDATLRWNSCVRTIEFEHLEPESAAAELPLE